MHNDRKGFTLIELLVVIAIIGLLASIILADLSFARVKAEDAKRMADVRSIQTALEAYNIDHNTMPINQTPGIAYFDTQPNFLAELVTGGYLPETPHAPPDSWIPYGYYDYGPRNDIGAIVVTVMETIGPTPLPSTGYPGTCRPFASGPDGPNWCVDDTLNNLYCLCLPY